MKGGRRSRATGGENEAEEDLKDKPEPRTNAKEVDSEAEEMKKGGRAKKYKRGGKTEVGHIDGHKSPMHAGRKPRKSGGRTGSEANPFTGANKGKEPEGHKTMGPDPVIAGMDQKA